MSFYDVYKEYKNIDLEKFFDSVSEKDIEKALSEEICSIESFMALLSFKAETFIELMAHKAQELTLQYFGKTIQLYTPIYLADHCDNKCVYCGFNKDNDIPRSKLSFEEVEKEAKIIAQTGLKHILVLVGESRKHSPLSYIKQCVGILKKYFDSVSVEIYVVTQKEYEELVAIGVDGVTVYQEVYDQERYDQLHLAGPKKNYMFRLDAPERAAKANMRTVNIGALLGLYDFRKESFFTALHARYLQDKYTDAEIGVSVPRLTEHKGEFKATDVLTDKNLVQIILALRIFLPRVGIALSTRENAVFRDNLVGLGITKMSAGTSTAVGGRFLCDNVASGFSQFELSDRRSVDQMIEMLRKKEYQPVLKDWMKV